MTQKLISRAAKRFRSVVFDGGKKGNKLLFGGAWVRGLTRRFAPSRRTRANNTPVSDRDAVFQLRELRDGVRLLLRGVGFKGSEHTS